MIADTPRNRLAALLHDPTYGMPDFRDCLDFADRLIAAGVTFATPRPAEIDVERLARALAPHFGPSYFPGSSDVTIFGKSPEAIAKGIAAAYTVDPERGA